MINENASDWSYEEWHEIVRQINAWLVKVQQSLPDLPDEAWPLLHRLFNLVDKLNDILNSGDFMKACKLLCFIEYKVILLWLILIKRGRD